MPQLKSSISTLRVKDAETSREFFAKLGFSTVWQHRAAEGFPLFVEVNRDSVSFFLSEHEGDGPFGVYVYLVVEDATTLFEEFRTAEVTATEPAEQPWGHTVFEIEDLDGNHLSFGSPTQD